MTFNILLTIALAICVIGLLLRAKHWFADGVTSADRELSVGVRTARIVYATFRALFGSNIFAVFKGLILDGLFQVRLFRADRIRWLAHILIFWGFVPLLVLHAMDGIVTTAVFPEYESTLNPWLFLRNLFGLMVVAGLALAAGRRITSRSRLKTSAMDVAVLVLVGAIVLSGFVIEGAKIASQNEFYRMVEMYHDPDETEEVAALEALWVTEYGLAASHPGRATSAEQLELGREVNDFACIDCHARPQWAAGSYAVSRLLTPFSRDKDNGSPVTFAYWLHVILCFGALAWLPFGKMRHVVTSLLSCIADRYQSPAPDLPLRAVNRMLALDACTRCGLCSQICSVGICAELLHNRYILPSEKLESLGRVLSSTNGDARKLLEGLTVCTNCLRCTGVCPVGINLQDLWDAVREELLVQAGDDVYALSPLGIHRSESFAESFAATQESLERFRHQEFSGARETSVFDAGDFGGLLRWTADDGAFRLCFDCKTCTSSCPIVGLEDLQELGLAPHQIIHATTLGLDELVASSRMLWACLGCYRCQDSCPQGVRVADVLYIHKNNALARMKGALSGKED
jgi:heterodisulfide reductase subunit C/nitrate reductase gamma subunit